MQDVQQALTTSASIKAGQGTVRAFDWYNPNSSAIYVFLYDSTTAPTPGSKSGLVYQKGLPAGAGSNFTIPGDIYFDNGIWIAVSTLPAGNTAPSTGAVLTTVFD